MGINAKGGIKVVSGKAYVHPLTLEDLEFLMKMIANNEHSGFTIQRVMEITLKLQKEYKKLSEHLSE